MGLSLGAVFDPVGGEASTPFDPLFAVMAGLLFLVLNLHLAVVSVLADSFSSLPIGGDWPTGLFGAAVAPGRPRPRAGGPGRDAARADPAAGRSWRWR